MRMFIRDCGSGFVKMFPCDCGSGSAWRSFYVMVGLVLCEDVSM